MNLRIKNLRKKIQEKNLDGLFISNASNIFYLSGFSFIEPAKHEGFILISRNKSYFITSSLYAEAIWANLKDFELLEIKAGGTLEEILKEITKKIRFSKVGFENDSLTVSEFVKLKGIFPLKSTNQIIENLRQVKEENEIEKIKKACETSDKCFEYILKEIKLGVSEIEIQNKIKRFFEDLGFESAFNPIVAFGAHSSMPHHVSNKTKLKNNQIVLLDFGVMYEGYCSDMTRTVFYGKANEKFKKIYETVLDAQTKAFEFINRKSSIINLRDIDKLARNQIIKKGYSPIPHSLGHGLGIEVHDGLRLSPTSKDKLQNNMVFTLEPGIYIPGYGGVRIEDDVVYQKGKLEFLTHSTHELIEI